MRVLDRGLHDGRGFLVMPLVPERTLASMLHAGEVPPADTPRILAAIRSALDALHAAGIQHGDVRPENVGVGNDGTVTVLDVDDPSSIRATDDDEAWARLVIRLREVQGGLHASGLPPT